MGLKLLASVSQEEKEELKALENGKGREESVSSSSSSEEEDSKPFKLKEALKQRRKLERQQKTAKKKYEKFMER